MLVLFDYALQHVIFYLTQGESKIHWQVNFAALDAALRNKVSARLQAAAADPLAI